jgi:hypothetical protein
MIHYQLRCSQEHEFDGWFPDSAGFDRQVTLKLVECPQCGNTDIERALMAPALGRNPKRQHSEPAPVEASPTEAKAAVALPPSGPLPDQMRSMLQRLRAEVEKNCDYVGPDFADEARKMHRGESDRRGIYGETTPEQAESLADDGIEVTSIPWVPRADG